MRRRFVGLLVLTLLGASAVHCQDPAPGPPTRVPVATTTPDAGAREPSVAARGALPTRDAICARAATPLPLPAGAKPFTRPDGLCKGYASSAPEPCGMTDRYDYPPTPADRCYLADANIDDASRRVLQGTRIAPAPRTSGTSSMSPVPPPPMPAERAWDRSKAPKYAAKVDAHLHFTEGERAMLAKNGFVVLERKQTHSYVAAYHDVFQEQLPLYVTTDSILHAVFRSEDALLEGIERTDLKKRVVALVHGLRAALRAVPPSEAAEDVDLYLTVAEHLLGHREEHKARFEKNDDRAREIATKTDDSFGKVGIATVEMYGRKRDIDFSKFTPAGHYAGYRPDDSSDGKTAPLSFGDYFRTVTWLSRHEWNLVTRGCQSSTPVAETCSTAKTPREARAAMLVAELVDRGNLRPHLDRFEQVYATFGGTRDDVPIASFRGFGLPSSQAPNAPDALATAVGEKYVRYAVTHPMPVFPGDHEGKLPAIATLIGARVAPDLDPVGAVMREVYPANLDADVFGALLGHDASLHGAPKKKGHDLALSLAPKLRAASAAGASLYDKWMSAVLALSTPAEGVLPSFWKTEAHAALRFDSALVGYGQIRHNFVLMSGSAYDAYGCDIPDAYVEPHLAVYEALLEYSERGRAMAGKDAASRDYFTHTSSVLKTLIAIVKHELEGRALTSEETRWLGMVTEYTPEGGYGGDSHGPPKRMGWYYDLFTDRTNLAEKGSDFIGEVATNANTHYAFMLGAEAARLGVFVVDVGGEPRMMVGPVATGYEARDGLVNARWTDATAWKKPHVADWSKAYTAPAPIEPDIDGKVERCDDGTLRVFVRSTVPVDAEIELTDHHGDVATPKTKLAILPEGTLFAIHETAPVPAPAKPQGGGDMLGAMGYGAPRRGPSPFAGLHLRIAAHKEGKHDVPAHDLVLGPSVYHADTGRDRDVHDDVPHLPRQRLYKDLEYFALGALEKPAPEPRKPGADPDL